MIKTISLIILWITVLIIFIANMIALINGNEYVPYFSGGLSAIMFVAVSAILHMHIKYRGEI